MLIQSYAALKTAIENGESELYCSGRLSFSSPICISRKQHIRITGDTDTVFSGTQTVQTGWEKYGENLFVCTVPKNLEIDALFVNGTPYILARYPNYREGECLNGCTTYADLAERLSRYSEVSGGYVRAIHKREWGGNDYILESAKNGRLGLRWMGDNNRGKAPNRQKMLVENLLQELDAPKEWFYDKAKGLLYVYFQQDIVPAEACVEYSVLSSFFTVENASDITFQNIQFEKTNRTLFSAPYIPVTRSDWCVAQTAAILVQDCASVHIVNCGFRYIGGNCIYFKDKNRDCTVEHCSFTDTGASGVLLYGSQSACWNLSTWKRHRIWIADRKAGPKNDLYPENCTVRDCIFNRTGRFEKQSAPVSLSVARSCKILGNTICNVPRAGVNICDGTFGGHLIADNDIFNTVQETGDHGCFNSWGRDRFWSYRGFNTTGALGRQKKKYCLLDATAATVIRHNRIAGDHGFGIDLDDGSTNYEICSNFCCGVGIKLREGFYRKVYNNILLGAPLDLHCSYWGNDDEIHHNIVCCPNPVRPIMTNSGFTTKIENNLFVGCTDSVLQDGIFANSRTASNTVLADNTQSLPDLQKKLQGFVPFPLEFGRPDGEKPKLHTENTGAYAVSVRCGDSVLRNIDESIRTVGGLADYDGVYVESAGELLKKFGVRTGDVLLRADGRILCNASDFEKYIASANEVQIMRNQHEMTLRRAKKHGRIK